MGLINQSRNNRNQSGGGVALAGFGLAMLVVALSQSTSAAADTTITGPIDLGAAAPFSVLAGTEVTNVPVLGTGVWGNIGVSPGTSITGFPPGTYGGALHPATIEAASAQADLTAAFNVAAGLTPMESGIGNLNGRTLVPGVYSGGALSLTDTAGVDLTLAGTGSANDVWVFQASSTLITDPGSEILITGATACNVFWQVGSSATLGVGSTFVGTVMADAQIAAQTNATIAGRLLARTALVSLDQNVITNPGSCTAGTLGVSPVVTGSTEPTAAVGVPYSSGITATGTPSPTDGVTSGALPPGLTMATSGAITGTPTTAGTFNFDVTVSNGVSPAVVTAQQIVVRAGLAVSGSDPGPVLALGMGAFALGAVLLFSRHGVVRRATRAVTSSGWR
ncbi:MAG: ice-binding family protein [Pseudolysinimonas sp.]